MKRPQQIFSGFHVATMARPGSILAHDTHGRSLFQVPEAPYGSVLDAAVGISGEQIDWVLPRAMLPDWASTISMVHGHGRWLTPGLIDCHTHLVYGGNRAWEWEARLGGKSYQELAASGGGILATVRNTRCASPEDLRASAERRLQRLMREGVTTIEIKSGYGLSLRDELKMLQVAQALGRQFPVRVEPTLLAAHAVPPEYTGRSDEYIDHICQAILPAAVPYCTAVDAFCETIAFSPGQTLRLLEAAHQQGLRFKVHAEQLSRTGISVAVAQRGALSVDHLEYLAEEDCSLLGQTRTVATLLPGAYYCLRETQMPPVAALRRSGVPMAVATDCNPGSSPVVSLLLAGHLACTLFRITPEEALLGVTRWAAQALGLESQLGTLEPGKQADLAVWNVESPGEIFYSPGENPCTASYFKGIRRARSDGP